MPPPLHLPISPPADKIPFMNSPKWLAWAQKLQAIAQSGLTYNTNAFDRERYEAVSKIAAEILSDNCGADPELVNDLFATQSGYLTPKIDIRGVVFKENRILLVKERSDGGWTLPGGWVDINEPPSRAVEREVFEESGYEVKAEKLLAVYDRNQHGHTPEVFHTYKLYFECRITGGSPQTSIETDGCDFFCLENLPQLSIARVTPEVLQRLFRYNNNPQLLADFD